MTSFIHFSSQRGEKRRTTAKEKEEGASAHPIGGDWEGTFKRNTKRTTGGNSPSAINTYSLCVLIFGEYDNFLSGTQKDNRAPNLIC